MMTGLPSMSMSFLGPCAVLAVQFAVMMKLPSAAGWMLTEALKSESHWPT